MSKGIWYPVKKEPEADLIDEENIWLAFSDGAVVLGKYYNPPFNSGNNDMTFFGTTIGARWAPQWQPTHWMKANKPEHPGK